MREGVGQRRIPVAGPSITDKEVAYVLEAVRDGWYGHANDFIVRFERAFADYLGVRHAVSLPSATSAIHLSLAALGIGPGDEVIVPDPTWIATSAPISYVGATPVFADVDPVTWCLDAQSLEARITPRTKAVIPVDLYGGVPDWEAIRAVAARHSIAVIEDAAEAIGSEFRGERAGTFGATGVFSFHGSKTLTTGEGGMLVTDDDAIIDRVRVLRDHGRRPGDTMFRNAEVAFKYKMSGMQAALGLAQLERIGELIGRKRVIFGWYQRELGGVEGLTLNAEPAGTCNTFWMVTVIVAPAFDRSKEQIVDSLRASGVDCRPFFYPLSSLDAYRDLPYATSAASRNPVSYRLSATGVNLPSALSLTEEDVVVASDALKAAIGLA
jgi:perosamine synthetase